jgi:hypothetical protein
MTATPQIGDKILFLRADGKLCKDTVRGLFVQDDLLEPYARNRRRFAVTLTEHSWCYADDLRGSPPIRPDYDADPRRVQAFRKVFYVDSLGRTLRDFTADCFRSREEACVYWWMLARHGVVAVLDCGLDGEIRNTGKQRRDEPAEMVAAIDLADADYRAADAG